MDQSSFKPQRWLFAILRFFVARNPSPEISECYRWSKDLSDFHVNGDAYEGTTVTFNQGSPTDGIVTVTATITGTPVDRLFVDVAVIQN